MSNIDKKSSPKRLSLLDYHVLSCVRDLRDNEAYGVRLQEEVSKIYQQVGYGSVYASLQRLKKSEFVTSKMGEPSDLRGGKAVRYFRITDLGLNALEETYNHLSVIFAPKRKRRCTQLKIDPAGGQVALSTQT